MSRDDRQGGWLWSSHTPRFFLCMIMASCYATKSFFFFKKGSFYVGYGFVSCLPFAFCLFFPVDHGLYRDARGW